MSIQQNESSSSSRQKHWSSWSLTLACFLPVHTMSTCTIRYMYVSHSTMYMNISHMIRDWSQTVQITEECTVCVYMYGVLHVYMCNARGYAASTCQGLTLLNTEFLRRGAELTQIQNAHTHIIFNHTWNVTETIMTSHL